MGFKIEEGNKVVIELEGLCIECGDNQSCYAPQRNTEEKGQCS